MGKMKPLYNQRYPINTKLNDPHTVRMGGMDVVHWMPSKASRFDVVVTETPEDRQTEDYLAIPRGQEEDVENSETEDYLAIPREDEEDEENSETEDYLAIPRGQEEDIESSETEDYLAIPRGQEEDIESSETEDYEFVPRNDHGPGGDHAVRKTRYLSPENFD